MPQCQAGLQVDFVFVGSAVGLDVVDPRNQVARDRAVPACRKCRKCRTCSVAPSCLSQRLCQEALPGCQMGLQRRRSISLPLLWHPTGRVDHDIGSVVAPAMMRPERPGSCRVIFGCSSRRCHGPSRSATPAKRSPHQTMPRMLAYHGAVHAQRPSYICTLAEPLATRADGIQATHQHVLRADQLAPVVLLAVAHEQTQRSALGIRKTMCNSADAF